jgi:uncharacterized protein with HEPN domain
LPSDRPDEVLFPELAQSAAWIGHYMDGQSRDDFGHDQMRRDAVCMRLIVIGEAANRMSDEGRATLPELNWNGMAGLRHLLAHDYGSASPSLLWNIATVNVPALVAALKAQGRC